MAVSGTSSGPVLLIELDRAASEPLHRQLADGLLLGYANLTESAIDAGVHALARAAG
jgi:hypothetical protein